MKPIVKLVHLSLLAPLLAALPCAAQNVPDTVGVGPVPAHADARVATVQVLLTPDRADWTYKVGEPVRFRVQVFADSNAIDGVPISYEIGPEGFPREWGQAHVPADGLLIDGRTMNKPGFLQCTVRAKVDGRTYNAIATAAFEPENIQPTQKNPDDFDAFWNAARADLAKVPMDVQMELIPEQSRGTVNVYHVSARVAANGARVYGMLAMPKAPGKYPALLRVPGAGVYPHHPDTGFAAQGVIVFSIGIHGIPVNLAPELYSQLNTGALNGYPTLNLDNKHTYYYRRVYLSCLRAVDFLASLPEWNGENIGVIGVSQGGQLTMVTAGLDNRITAICVTHPAYCDVTGYLEGRAGGFPHMFRPAADGTASANAIEEKIATTAYFDVVNFARRIKAPGLYTLGYNDVICPPTSIYAAYNVIDAPKTLILALETGHFSRNEQTQALNEWMLAQLKGKAK